MIKLALLFALSASAAPAPHAKPYWMKNYSLAPYRETWTGELAVKKVDETLPKLVAAVEKNGGHLVQPLANSVGAASEQQVSLIVPLPKAKALLAALRKLGKAADPAVRPHGEKIPLDEVRAKIAALTFEKNEKWGALAQTPAASEAVDEMLEHLVTVEAVARATDGEVLWNLTVKEKR